MNTIHTLLQRLDKLEAADQIRHLIQSIYAFMR
ncbi:Uncharacterised protein [Raoultella terrigena]|uniref:Uncharacterized protein n=1 Tax=Raoultella terrigena TaxID=577 RepID=A0A4U9D2Q6_RAOTE|nr:Uncharacterised protein [Raoultella terrigena]